VAVSTTDGCISIPESAQYYGDAVRQLAHEKRPLNKLGYRKIKRTLRRLEKQQPSASSERRANENRIVRWPRPTPPVQISVCALSSEQLLSELARSGARRLRLTGSAVGERARRREELAVAKSDVAALYQQAREEAEHHRHLIREATEQAVSLAAGTGGTCRACGEQPACMLALDCGHVTLCRTCWEGDLPRDVGGGGGGGARRKRCAECGGDYQEAVQIFKPF
jgi:hypothetical protein